MIYNGMTASFLGGEFSLGSVAGIQVCKCSSEQLYKFSLCLSRENFLRNKFYSSMQLFKYASMSDQTLVGPIVEPKVEHKCGPAQFNLLTL